MNMFDEKNPGQESVKPDSSDDEVIIDLTEEIIVKTEDDTANLKISENLAADAQPAPDDDMVPEVEEDDKTLAPNKTNNFDLQGDTAVVDLDDQVAADQDEITEEQLIASAIEKSLSADEDENGEVTREYDLNASDEDDTIIVDNTPDEADENINAMAGNETAEDPRDEDVFDLEEEIELEYQLDDDEDDFVELDDERSEDNQDFVDLMLGVSNESDQSDDDEEPTEYLEFETEEKDDIIVLDADRDRDTEFIALAEDAAPEFVDSDNLPDLEGISAFDYEEEEDDDQALDEAELDDSDDIIARAVEQSLGSDDDGDQVDPADEAGFGIEDDDTLIDLDISPKDDEQFPAPAEEDPLKFKDDKKLPDLDEGADLETDDQVIPLDGFNDLEAEDGEEIIEITEFDQHFSADGEALLKQSGKLNASGADEQDFLELLDVEEDSLSDDEAVIEFSDSPKATDDAKINQFFSDDLEEDQLESLAPDSIFSDDDRPDLSPENEPPEYILDVAAEMKNGREDEVPAVSEEAPDINPESTTDGETPISQDEKSDFDFDPGSIAQQIDRLDLFQTEEAADEPEAASLLVEKDAEEETGLENSQTGQDLDGLPPIPAGQIDAAIERIINEKFSGKIEDIIYQVIEKAVAKEIDRLKGALMGSNTIDDYED